MSDFDVMTREFEQSLDLYDKKTLQAASRALNQNGLDLWKEAAKLAPKDKGRLEGSGYSTKPKRNTAGEQEVTTGFNTSYAAKVHETMWPAVNIISARSGGGQASMQPGETTRNKPPTEFGEAGGKYLERPLFGKATRYTKNIADKVKAVK